MEKYTSKYTRLIGEQMKASSEKDCPACKGTGVAGKDPCLACKGTGKIADKFIERYQWEVDFKFPPVLEIVRSMDEAVSNQGTISIETKDRLLHLAIIGRPAKLSYDGVELGSFVSNSKEDVWDNFPVLADNPSALRLLMDLALSFVMSKWMPPQVGAPTAAAVIPGLRK
jgi:hypothetical protein